MAFSTSIRGSGCGRPRRSDERTGPTDFGPIEAGEVKPRFALDRFTNHASVLNDGLHGIFDDLLVDLDQLDRMFDHARFGIAAMSLAGQVLQRVLHGRPGPVGAVAVDAQLGRQFIGGLEADATDVVGQLVRVLLDLGDGLVAVGAVDADGPARA